MLSGHIDTVPVNTPTEWSRPPLGASIEDGRVYGRGAWDMKAGVAMNLTVLSAITELRIPLAGDLIFETVADEEFGGGAGTLAARLRGYNADAAVIGEPTFLHVCPAQRGGQVVHITLHGSGGILNGEGTASGTIDQLAYVLARIPEFVEERKAHVSVDPYFEHARDPYAVWVTNVSTGQWGWSQPITIPEQCRIEIYWQTMPCETADGVMAEFSAWWNGIVATRPDLFRVEPAVEIPSHYLSGSSIPPDSPLVTEFAGVAAKLGVEAPVDGLDAPTDMSIFQNCFNTPALLWGPSGGNAHQADEFVDIESLFDATRVLLHFVVMWCGVKQDSSS